MVLETEVPDPSPAGSVPGESSLPSLQVAPFLLPLHMARREREAEKAPVSLLTRTVILLDQGLTLMTSFNPNCPLRGPSPHAAVQGVNASAPGPERTQTCSWCSPGPWPSGLSSLGQARLIHPGP